METEIKFIKDLEKMQMSKWSDSDYSSNVNYLVKGIRRVVDGICHFVELLEEDANNGRQLNKNLTGGIVDIASEATSMLGIVADMLNDNFFINVENALFEYKELKSKEKSTITIGS